MRAVRPIAALLGVAFGFVLAWTQMTDPDVIRRMLLLEEAYLFLVMASSMAVAFAGLRLLRRLRVRAPATGLPVAWALSRPARRHVAGSVFFGVGWGLSNACPGPVVAQLGQGFLWGFVTLGGIAVGIEVHRAVQRRVGEDGGARGGLVSHPHRL